MGDVMEFTGPGTVVPGVCTVCGRNFGAGAVIVTLNGEKFHRHCAENTPHIPVNLPFAEGVLDYPLHGANVRDVIRNVFVAAGAKVLGQGGGMGAADVSIEIGGRRYWIDVREVG